MTRRKPILMSITIPRKAQGSSRISTKFNSRTNNRQKRRVKGVRGTGVRQVLMRAVEREMTIEGLGYLSRYRSQSTNWWHQVMLRTSWLSLEAKARWWVAKHRKDRCRGRILSREHQRILWERTKTCRVNFLGCELKSKNSSSKSWWRICMRIWKRISPYS